MMLLETIDMENGVLSAHYVVASFLLRCTTIQPKVSPQYISMTSDACRVFTQCHCQNVNGDQKLCLTSESSSISIYFDNFPTFATYSYTQSLTSGCIRPLKIRHIEQQ